MARSDMAAIIADAGLPAVYHQWPDGSTPAFPCVRYVKSGENNVNADNAKYFCVDEFDVFLVSEWKDEASEQALEAAFERAGLMLDMLDESYNRAERLYTVMYQVQAPR